VRKRRVELDVFRDRKCFLVKRRAFGSNGRASSVLSRWKRRWLWA
jgi:hypothetical protein